MIYWYTTFLRIWWKGGNFIFKSMHKVNKHGHRRKGWEKESNTLKGQAWSDTNLTLGYLRSCTSPDDPWTELYNIESYWKKLWKKHSSRGYCYSHDRFHSGVRFRVMLLNAVFNNISVLSWRSVLLVEETGAPKENHRPAAIHWQTLSCNVLSSTHRHERVSNSQP